MIVSGAILFHRKYGPYTGEPLWSSKLNTALQLLLATLLLANQSVFSVGGTTIQILVFFATLTTLWSGIAYVVIWSDKAKKAEVKS